MIILLIPFETCSYTAQHYIQGYIVSKEKILGLSDPNDTRIAGVFCQILDEIDIEKHPLCTCTWNGQSETVIMLTPDAYAEDIETLEGKGLQPTYFMEQISEKLLEGPHCIPCAN